MKAMDVIGGIMMTRIGAFIQKQTGIAPSVKGNVQKTTVVVHLNAEPATVVIGKLDNAVHQTRE